MGHVIRPGAGGAPLDLRFPAGGNASDGRDDDYWRRRVGLFLQVMLAIDLVAYVSDYVTPMVVDGLTMPAYPLITSVLRYASTAVVAAGWAVTRFRRPGRPTLIAIESGTTIWLALVYARIASTHMTADEAAYAPIFAMFGIMLLLSARAALVPSPVVRTVVIGLATMAALFTIGQEAIAALTPRVFEGLTFIGGAFVIATGVTSHVIYGLRREVRQALRLGQYTLEQKLGEGGMGAVYRARHALLRRDAAIKLVRPELVGADAERTTALARFEREAHVTAGLRSPHTIELYDFGIADDGAFYYVMELLDGINLEVAVTRYGPMPAARVVYLLRQVCESLEEAHAAGLVHRDIKPANIFLCHYGLRHDFVKVLDFGLVASAPESAGARAQATAEHFAAGTPAYLAPESVTAPGLVDGRADIYGVGCVAYWLLTGHAPFERETPMATILAHVNDPPVPPSRLAGTPVPAALDALVLECLAKDPAARPASAGGLSMRLSAAVEGRTWGQALAEQWWTSHRPVREAAALPAADEVTVTVVRG